MKQKKKELSSYRSMWLFAMFDLPVNSSEARNRYTRFRKGLLRQGFLMMQYSVYARFCSTEEKSEIFKKRIKQLLPPDGDVRLLAVTDRQFGKMEAFIGKKKVPTEKPPEQLLLF